MKYYLLKDYGRDGYSLEEYETLEEAAKEIEREMKENWTEVKQYRIFEAEEMRIE